MLQQGGATVRLMGFRRTVLAPAGPGAEAPIDLGRTRDGKFVHRLWNVIRTVIFLGKHASAFTQADIVLARNLEMLAIGARGLAIARQRPVLVYECLDIHRLLLGNNIPGKALRRLEGWLASKAAALVTSSPAFVSEYFAKRSRVRLPIFLLENKVDARSVPAVSAQQPRPPGPPWRIGWFGVIRCRESLQVLRNLVLESEGRVEVIIRGRPALDQFDDFARDTTGVPGLSFAGPYKNPDDLAAMYRQVHFTWAIDRFEAGMNSLWLLPNRLYEGAAFASVPIAEASVETGRFLARVGAGVFLAGDLETSLRQFFATLGPSQYHDFERQILNIPFKTWTFDENQCRILADYMRDLCGKKP